MKYSIKAKRKYISRMKEKLAGYNALTDAEFLQRVQLCISDGNEKIGRALNVSQAPIFTCANCSGCSDYCYDIKANLQYGNVLDARARNTVFWRRFPDLYFKAIAEKMQRRRKNFFFRFHVAGDIPNTDYLRRMVDLATRFPKWIVWTYTKNYIVVNEYVRTHGGTRAAAIPENLKIMFSEWDGMPLINPYDFPIFTCKLAAGNQNHPAEFFETLYKCPGNCDLCKPSPDFPCGRGCIVGESTYADEH